MQTRGRRRPTESSDQAGLAAVEGQSRIGELGEAAASANVMVGERLRLGRTRDESVSVAAVIMDAMSGERRREPESIGVNGAFAINYGSWWVGAYMVRSCTALRRT